MVQITSKTTVSSFTYSDSTFLINGEYKEDGEKQMQSVSMNITDTKSIYCGSANAYMDGGEVKYNISAVSLDNMQPIAQSIKTCVEELQAKADE